MADCVPESEVVVAIDAEEVALELAVVPAPLDVELAEAVAEDAAVEVLSNFWVHVLTTCTAWLLLIGFSTITHVSVIGPSGVL